MKAYIGVDNGVTGTVSCVTQDGRAMSFRKIPVFMEQNYTKKKGNITRIDWKAFRKYLASTLALVGENVRVFIERPMVNNTRFKASTSALRSLEAVLICVESMKLSYEYIDSKQWQRVLLPKGIKGTSELKKASVTIGCRLFPDYAEVIQKHKDADSLLIAEWARRMGL